MMTSVGIISKLGISRYGDTKEVEKQKVIKEGVNCNGNYISSDCQYSLLTCLSNNEIYRIRHIFRGD